jgi:hypothetical protein
MHGFHLLLIRRSKFTDFTKLEARVRPLAVIQTVLADSVLLELKDCSSYTTYCPGTWCQTILPCFIASAAKTPRPLSFVFSTMYGKRNPCSSSATIGNPRSAGCYRDWVAMFCERPLRVTSGLSLSYQPNGWFRREGDVWTAALSLEGLL